MVDDKHPAITAHKRIVEELLAHRTRSLLGKQSFSLRKNSPPPTGSRAGDEFCLKAEQSLQIGCTGTSSPCR